MNTALIVIDLQKAIDHPSWGERNNPDAENNVAALLQEWRRSQRPIYHIRHDSAEPRSHYRLGQPGNEFKPEARPLPGETVIAKRTNSAFIGTDLEQRLRSLGQAPLLVTGVITNNSVEATVRMAGNLGFDTFLVEDACFTFGRNDWQGRWRTAEEVQAMSLANLDGEYCTVSRTADVLAAAGAPSNAVENLILDLLEFVGSRERTYEEVMAAWRTSCPRLSVWEDATDRRLVVVENGELVRLTAAGAEFLAERRPAQAPSCDAVENLESLWESLAVALDAAGAEREVLFLSKLAILFGNEVQDPARVRELIGRALQDLT